MDLAPYRTENQRAMLPSRETSKDTESRLRAYADWLDLHHHHWAYPELDKYRDYLLARGLKPVSVRAHLSTIRSRYRDLIRDRAAFFSLFQARPSSDVTPEIHFMTVRTLVDEVIKRIENAIDPREAPLSVTRHQDKLPGLRLTREEGFRLLHAPGIDTLQGKRDTALIAVLLATGLRAAEACNLRVEDYAVAIDTDCGRVRALYVRRGKGNKSRYIPYGEMWFVLQRIDDWLVSAGIENGLVFRSIDRHGRVSHSLTPRAVGMILARYPVLIKGKRTVVRPHDCRRSYARAMADSGMPIEAIMENMGHVSIDQTLEYIGSSDFQSRSPTQDPGRRRRPHSHRPLCPAQRGRSFHRGQSKLT